MCAPTYNRYYILGTHIIYVTKINLKIKKRVVIYALHIGTFTCQRVRIVYWVIKFNFGTKYFFLNPRLFSKNGHVPSTCA